MTLQQTILENIAFELRTRYNLAHQSATSAAEIITAELEGAMTQYETARAMGDTYGMHYQKQRGAALLAQLKAIKGAA